MTITEVRITLLQTPPCIGLASVTLEDVFVVTGIRIMDGKKGLFVSMPSRKNKEGDYQDICFPVTADFREYLHEKVLQEYNAKYKKEKNVESVEDEPFPF